MKHLLISFLSVLSVTAHSIESSNWQLDSNNSQITFIATADNAPFDGQFNGIQALLELNESELTKSHLQISIDLTSIDSQSEDGDALLKGSDFFNVAQWSQATFSSESIEHIGENDYSCIAIIRIKDIQQRVSVTFKYHNDKSGDFIQLQGNLPIRRLDFDIGLGDWVNTDWVADEVNIEFNLRLIPAD